MSTDGSTPHKPDPVTLASLVLVVVVLLVSSAVSYRNLSRLHQDAAWVAHSHEVIEAGQSILEEMLNAETGQRGFLITGVDRYLEPHDKGVAAVREELNRLATLTRDNPEQQARLPGLREQVETRLSILQDGIVQRRENGFEAANDLVRLDRGRQEMMLLRAALDEFVAEERGLLAERSQRSEISYARGLASGFLTAMLALGSVAAFVVLLRRMLKIRDRAAEAVHREREHLRVTLGSIGDGTIATDTEGRVTFLNAVAESLTGWTFADAQGQSLLTVFHIVNEDTRAIVDNPVTRALKEGLIVGLANHTLLIARDGRERAIADSAAPIRARDGSILGAVLVFRDVSEERKAEKELARSEARKTAILDSALDCVITCDHEGRVVEFNPAAERTFGYRKEQVLGHEMGEYIVPPSMRERHLQGMARYLQTGEARILNRRLELSGLRADRTEFPLEVSIVRIVGDGPPMFTAYLRDITDRKQAEAALRQAHDQLERRVADLRTEVAQRTRAEAAVQEQSELWRTTLASVGDAVLTTDAEGRVTFLNAIATELTGWTLDDALGLPTETVFHIVNEETGERVESPVEKVLRTGRIVGLANHTVLIARDGTRRPIDDSGAPIRRGEGIAGVVLVFRDFTERRQAEVEMLRQARELQEAHQLVQGSERQFRTLANSIAQLAWMARADGHIFWYNQRWFDYTGTTLEQMEGWGWKSVHDPLEVTRVEEKFRAHLASGEPWEDTFPLRRHDGEMRWHLSRALPVRDEHDRIVLWFGTNTDITDRMDLENDLRRMAADLSESDRRKTEFLATLAHELRNPLAPIRTGLELMKLAADDPRTMEETRGMMERQAAQMVRLIDDLLDLSRITQGKLQLRKARIALQEVVKNSVEATRPFIDEAGHTLHVSVPAEPIRMEADPNRLAQIVSNLLSNAAKYTPDGGQIWLSLELDDGTTVFRVRDTGLGIPPDMQARVFEMFTQIDRPVEKGYTGLGIGLTLVKRLVEMHDGTIAVHSAGHGQGSEFTIRLPHVLDLTAPPSTPEPASSTGLSRSLKILVVDDNKAAAETLLTVLRIMGNELRIAHDGEEAVQVAEEFRPEVVLMDLGMPKLTGYEAARRIREQPWGQTMHLVALTGWGQEEDKQRTRDAGFDHHLTKPAEPAALQALLRSLG